MPSKIRFSNSWGGMLDGGWCSSDSATSRPVLVTAQKKGGLLVHPICKAVGMTRCGSVFVGCKGSHLPKQQSLMTKMDRGFLHLECVIGVDQIRSKILKPHLLWDQCLLSKDFVDEAFMAGLGRRGILQLFH